MKLRNSNFYLYFRREAIIRERLFVFIKLSYMWKIGQNILYTVNEELTENKRT